MGKCKDMYVHHKALLLFTPLHELSYRLACLTSGRDGRPITRPIHTGRRKRAAVNVRVCKYNIYRHSSIWPQLRNCI